MFAGRRRFVLVALFALVASLMAVASPAVGTPPDNPFVGSWVSDDLPVGTELRVQISKSGRFHTWDEEVISGLCVGGLVTSSGRGSFSGDVFETPGTNRTCHSVDGGTFELPDIPFSLDYEYNESSDTLTLTADDGCYYRTGSDPSVCVPAPTPTPAEGRPAETGNSLPPHLLDQRVFLFPCPDEFIYVGPDEPFHIRHGFGVEPGVNEKIGKWRFELAVNGATQPSKLYTVVNHGDTGAPALTRWFVTELPTGLSNGDVVEGFWYDADGLVESLTCEVTVVIGDPP